MAGQGILCSERNVLIDECGVPRRGECDRRNADERVNSGDTCSGRGACVVLVQGYRSVVMSASEILAQLTTLTPEDRERVRAQLDALDSAPTPLSAEEKRLVDQRVAAYRQNPGVAVPWAVAEAEIRKQARW